MSIDSDAAFTNTDGVPFPGNTSVNASGPSATDGTEFVKIMIDNYMFGVMQAMLDHTGQTPTGVTEAAGLSQFLDGLDLMCNAPGIVTEWNLNDDPGTTGHRALFLQGQGILRANFAALDSAVYVGDGNNAAVAAGGGAYFRADNSDGSSPNIAGVYLILPDRRGVVGRGLDVAAAIDPDGASRFLGDLQVDAMQRIAGNVGSLRTAEYPATSAFSGTGAATALWDPGAAGFENVAFDSANSNSPNIAKTDDVETRMYNCATHYVIWY